VKRALPWIAGAAILVAVLVVGLSQAGGRGDEQASTPAPFDLRAARAQLAGAPAPLAKLHDQSSRLLPGGVPAFEKRLATLKGRPVVLNKWASWCNPCRSEFPAMQQAATARGRTVAFVGLNSGDSLRPAKRFLARYPTPFPSYLDPGENIARAINAPANYPVTVFLDAKGKPAFIHQGAYRSSADIETDIDRYLGQ
jgi:cytochrome c biogenesis protein CcmG, thiol:disulfide interchange protein DsbE